MKSVVAATFSVLVLSSCKSPMRVSDGPYSQVQSTNSPVRYICGSDITLRDTDFSPVGYAQNNDQFKIRDERKTQNGYEYIRATESKTGKEVWVATMFLKTAPCKASVEGLPEIEGKALCEFTWDEKVGTTDYSIWDNYRRRNYYSPDRNQQKTLVGSAIQSGKTFCQKAQFLKPCFQRAVSKAEHSLSKHFKAWATGKGYDPVKILLALAEQETKMGQLADMGSNGVGILQIVTAFKSKNQLVSDGDNATWAGITHNILTNIDYSMRAAGVKLMENSVNNIGDLAYYYNGSPAHQAKYAANVERFYANLGSCGL